MDFTKLIVRAGSWTIAAFGMRQTLRLGTNIVLTRLLAPELFGIMVVVNTFRTGVTLISDVGIGQSLVVNKNADTPEFYDTAWTVNLIRCVLLWLVCVAIAQPLASYYRIEALAWIFPIGGLTFVLVGLTSLAPTLAQRRMLYKRLNVFNLVMDLVGYAGTILLALLSPTIWALALGLVLASGTRMIASYWLLPSVRHHLRLSIRYLREIISFGKWIFFSSIVSFLAMNFDRLYLAKAFPLSLLGVYGVSRSLAEPVGQLVGQLIHVIVFPLVASSRTSSSSLRSTLAPIRLMLLLAVAAGLSLIAAGADIIVGVLFDSRYNDAAWMLPILLVAAWFAILCDLNDATLMGLGRPSYGAVANCLKLGSLLIGLPLGFAAYGPAGAIAAVAAGDAIRYIPILVGQLRAGFTFGTQDLAATIAFFGLVAFWEWLRWLLGYGLSVGAIPTT